MTINERHKQIKEVGSMLRKQLNPNNYPNKRILEMMGVNLNDSTGFEKTIKEDDVIEETFMTNANLNIEVKSRPINDSNPLIYEILSINGETDIVHIFGLHISAHHNNGKIIDAVLASKIKGAKIIAEVDLENIPPFQINSI